MPLVVTSLSFGYRPDSRILRDIEVAFQPGTVTALVGPNGAGKTTLLRLLAGVLKPQAGSVRLGSDLVWSIGLRDRAKRLAYVAQRPAPAFAFTVRQYVGLGRFASGESDDQPAVSRALAAVDLADRADEVFGALSAGQQQRASIARALAQLDLAHPPAGSRVLLLDEPVSALDPRHSLQILVLLKDLATKGFAIVAALHDLSLVSRFCDRAAVLSEAGSLVSAGPIAESVEPGLLQSVFGVAFVRADLGQDGPVVVPSLAGPIGLPP